MMKSTPYNKVTFSVKPGVMFRDAVLNEFISEDGGFVRGNMIALAGTSGAGKTTLCKKLQKELPEDMFSVFFALESKKGSVQRQTKRIETGDHATISDENDYPTWTEFMEDLHKYVPELVIVDSLQHAAELLSEENGKDKYSNYKKIVKDLYKWKDEHNTMVILIVQLNSKGEVEGPVATVFDVDAPMFLIADPKTGERRLEASKNRMGGTIGKPIYYEFVEDDRIIEFFTPAEYEVRRQGVSLPDMITDAISTYGSAFVNHENYADFKKEFMKEYNKIYNKLDNDFDVCIQAITLMKELSEKYF